MRLQLGWSGLVGGLAGPHQMRPWPGCLFGWLGSLIARCLVFHSRWKLRAGVLLTRPQRGMTTDAVPHHPTSPAPPPLARLVGALASLAGVGLYNFKLKHQPLRCAALHFGGGVSVLGS